jgi:8-oxo-dGTP pyrophosphatase MutT (NUDIX family)
MEYTKYTVAVGLVLGNRLWMSKRVNTANFESKWQFAGGKLEELENPIDGGIREVAEETGLIIDAKRLRYIGPVFGDPTTRICYVYAVELNETEVPKLTEDKMTAWQLFTFNLASKLDLMPGLPDAIRELRKRYENEPEKLPSVANA